MKNPLRLIQSACVLGVLFAAIAFQPGGASSQAPAPTPAPTPTPTVVPDPISVPIASIEGPKEVKGTFMVLVKSDPAAKLTWSNFFPRDTPPPIELELKDGRTAQWFQDPPAGRYLFRVRAQIPKDGLDPVEDVEHVVTVGAGPAPPVVVDPDKPPVVVDPNSPVAVTYVFEKDHGAVPSGVLVGLDRLRRERNIAASSFEQDTRDGTGATPAQYESALKAAKESGLPALVVSVAGKVLRVVKAPTTEQQVWEAAL